MEITEVRIKLTADSDDRLQGFCSITFDDCFVVRDLKIIEGDKRPVRRHAQPETDLALWKVRQQESSPCVLLQPMRRQTPAGTCRPRSGGVEQNCMPTLAHPINSTCREMIQGHVIAEYQAELELAKEPGYRSRYEDDYDDDFIPLDDDVDETPPQEESPRKEKVEIQQA